MVSLSSATPAWRPSCEADLQAAIDGGLLDENHYWDGKRQVGDKPAVRKETARDLASFAVDGGSVLIGIAENKDAEEGQRWSLAPQPLAGLRERIEQVALTAIDPSLLVTTRVIESDADPAEGYVLVEVPISGTAPHQVDFVYYGRGDTTRIRLSDADVLRLHALRESVEDSGQTLLAAEIARDPVPEQARKAGHLYLVAQPLRGRSDLALDVTSSADERRWFMDVVLNSRGTSVMDPSRLTYWQPSPSSGSRTERRSHGFAVCSEAVAASGRQVRGYTADHEKYLVDIEVREDAGVRVLAGQMTWTDKETPYIQDTLAAVYARCLCGWLGVLGERVGYRGTWTLGIAANGLQGGVTHLSRDLMTTGYPPHYNEEEYQQVTSASHTELVAAPWEVARRLVGRLTRSLGTDQGHAPLLAPPDAR